MKLCQECKMPKVQSISLNSYRWQSAGRKRRRVGVRGCRIVWTFNWQGNQQRHGDRVRNILTGFRLKWLITSEASAGLATSSGCCCVVCCRGPRPWAWGDAVTVAPFSNRTEKSVFICSVFPHSILCSGIFSSFSFVWLQCTEESRWIKSQTTVN